MFLVRNLKQFSTFNKRCCVYFTKVSYSNAHSKFVTPKSQAKQIGPLGWFLLVIPASTFALGTWQVQRKKWKEDLIAKLHNLTEADPVQLPTDLNELEKLEYRPVHVRGEFLHDKELYLGPRTLILKGDSATKSQLMSTTTKQNQGFLVITPFKLADRNETILINRGWVPSKCKNPATRDKGQVKGVVDVVGIVRLQENRPTFIPKNQEGSNQWFYRDLNQMAKVTGALPVLLEATTDFDTSEGPIGGQTRVTLRNEHLSYILTWYSLSAATSYLWYKQFLSRVK
ncbi:surfeit locus protein 1 [Tribolium castaneum]|uniref:SURF1-like protein n=1 Tax=Tribolium castaneum TaxID=7070 RepID=D6WEG3_TRICA|nr:PREDICTED: surfeit locus protein 1 [Tribolium castaneum]EFA00352.1 SURF1-like protein [Tribolium castaneum]|eukprot:XP_972868.1 PREDICTED: surfeit locus protein 1 [Tribolium castaneum]